VSEENRSRKVLRALGLLEGRYGTPEPPAPHPPLETFLAAILMDAVPRPRAHEALDQLKKRLVDWNEARVSTGKEIAEYCRPVNVSEAAGRTVQRALEKVYAECSSLSLDSLKGKPAKEAREYLATFEGVSPASVAYTMLYGLQKSAIPVTPPILRVADGPGGGRMRRRARQPIFRADRAQREDGVLLRDFCVARRGDLPAEGTEMSVVRHGAPVRPPAAPEEGGQDVIAPDGARDGRRCPQRAARESGAGAKDAGDKWIHRRKRSFWACPRGACRTRPST
jgi:endonuclease III